jgi:hypothetical protein
VANKTECNRGCREKLKTEVLRRLARSFAPPNWAGAPLFDFDDAGSILGAVTGEEVKVLCDAGLLRAKGERIPAEELIRFLKAHGRWWYQLRLEKQIERLREDAARATRSERDLCRSFAELRLARKLSERSPVTVAAA